MAFAVFPPIEIRLPMVSDSAWVWLVLISGCLGLYTIFTKINIFVKAISAYLFISCFFSSAPLISFTAYIVMVPLIYFYILCTKIDDWKPITRALIIILVLNQLLLLMQWIGRDSLLNFGLKATTCAGTVGNPMQLKSLMIIATAVLIAITRPKKRYVALAAIIFLLASGYAAKHNIIQDFLYARGPVWGETFKLYLQHPIFGWGPAMFKTIFPALVRGTFDLEGVWRTTHNCWLQLLFETGAIGFSLVSGFFIHLFVKLKKINLYLFFGLAIIALDMMAHFPTRQIQCVPIMIAFLAYCEREIKLWQVRSLR